MEAGENFHTGELLEETPAGHKPRARLRRLRSAGLPPGVSGLRRTGGVARGYREFAGGERRRPRASGVDDQADSVTEEAKEESSSESEDEVVPRPKMAHVRESTDTLLQFVDCVDDKQIQGYYHHLRTLRELIIRHQYKGLKQIRLGKFIKPVPTSQPDSPPPSSQPPSSPTNAPPLSPQPSTSAASADEFLGFQ